MQGVGHRAHSKLALMYDDELQFRVQVVPSRYPVEHDRQDVADVHDLHGGWHGVHVLLRALG
jgi:hypothetical protein